MSLDTSSEYPCHSLTEWAALPREERTVSSSRDLGPKHQLHLRLAEKRDAQNIIVFMPAAQSGIENGQINPLFSRWAWAFDHPESHVVAISDPSISYHETLAGGWFVSPDFDVLQETASDLALIADALAVPRRNITIYGSSLGGFGAIALASILRDSYAIAEVPQVNVMDWPIASAKRNIETHITKMSLQDYYQLHPEQIDLLSRFQHENCVPGFTLVTNPDDTTFAGQMSFLQKTFDVGGSDIVRDSIHLIMESRISGHRVLSRPWANSLIRSVQAFRAQV